jgi:hypothetical protein
MTDLMTELESNIPSHFEMVYYALPKPPLYFRMVKGKFLEVANKLICPSREQWQEFHQILRTFNSFAFIPELSLISTVDGNHVDLKIKTKERTIDEKGIPNEGSFAILEWINNLEKHKSENMNSNNERLVDTITNMTHTKLSGDIYSLLNVVNNFIDQNELKPQNQKEIGEVLNKITESIRNSANGSFNLYPSEPRIPCHTFCLGIASLKFNKFQKKDQLGFFGLMAGITAYWVNCNSNDMTILLTAEWDHDKFQSHYYELFEAHRRKGKAIFVFELGTGSTGFFRRYPFNR